MEHVLQELMHKKYHLRPSQMEEFELQENLNNAVINTAPGRATNTATHTSFTTNTAPRRTKATFTRIQSGNFPRHQGL